MTEPADDTYIMPFGKYQGTSLGAVPASYLVWCYEQEGMEESRPELYAYLKKHIKLIKAEAGEEDYPDDMDRETYDDWRDR